MRKILIMGLPGSGKTTIAKEVASRLRAVHFNADEVRDNINEDLGFSEEDRITQARRMGWLCDQVNKAGYPAVADFVCPTPTTRDAFGDVHLVVFMDTIVAGRYKDTNRVFVRPRADLVINYVNVSGDSFDQTGHDRAVKEIIDLV